MIYHRVTERTEVTEDAALVSGQIIGAAVEVHKLLGPGLLESSYLKCLCRELFVRGIVFEREVGVPLSYKGMSLDSGYRVDLLVEGKVIVEVKAVAAVLPIHKAQLLTYLKLKNIRVGLLINFNTQTLVTGIRRVVNGY